MKITVRAVSLILCVLLMLPLAACGKTADTSAEATVTEPAEGSGSDTESPDTEPAVQPGIETVIALTDWGDDPRRLSASDAEKAAALLGLVKISSVPKTDGKPLTAKDEDGTLSVWFVHSYVNTPSEDTTPVFADYTVKLAKNETEGCHFMVSASEDKSGLSLKVSDIVNENGDALGCEVCYGYYFDDVDGKTVADPIPVLEHEFDLAAGRSQMFIIKIKTTAETAPGMYSATVSVYDGDKELKKAALYAFVWDFTLPVASSCKTLSDLNEWAVIVGGNREDTTKDGLEDDLYALYYEYLLENKVNCYTLPYAKRGQFWDDRVEQYIADPRCTAFTLLWKIAAKNDSELPDYLKAAYDRLSKDPAWLEKAYFYPDKDDEPITKAALDQIKAHDRQIKKVFGEHKLIIPMHYNTQLKTDGSSDHFEYLKKTVTVWCPHTFFFNSFADTQYNKDLTYRCTEKIEEKLGTFEERMAEQKAEGKEVWWYVTRYPHDPEITLSINDESIKHRLLFWQQKLYNVDGFLYYMVNDWEDAKNWTKKYEKSVGGEVVNTYGNGVLIYPGGALPEYVEKYGNDGYPGPIGSLRLESVRDGVEDYDYFTMLDQKYGEGTSDLVIKQITTSLGSYKTDAELFNALRTAAGDLLSMK